MKHAEQLPEGKQRNGIGHSGRASQAAGGNAQRGVALVIALILLVVVTMIGLAAVRGTILQNKMAANQHDREIAFQSASSALEVAKNVVGNNPSTSQIARDCSKKDCTSNPFSNAALAGKIVNVKASDYNAGATASGQPQYIIENMGKWKPPEADSGTGRGHRAGSKNLSSREGKTGGLASYYRITARSGNPAKVGGRAVVTLQIIYRGPST